MRYRKKRAVLCKIFCIDLPFHDDGKHDAVVENTTKRAPTLITGKRAILEVPQKNTHTQKPRATNQSQRYYIFFLLKTRPLIGGFESYAVSVSSRVCQGRFYAIDVNIV